VVVCYAKRNDNTVIATEILTVNEEPVDPTRARRIKFEDCDVCEPTERLNFGCGEDENPVLAKYLNWLLPMLKGQRGCIRSAPKTGKTSMLFELAKATVAQEDVKVFVLLLDQTPEIVTKFKKVIPASQLMAMTFETDAEGQVYAAELLLKRAKRYVESGYPTLLFVDSFNALAHAYNETDWSQGGKTIVSGLETKTLAYVKRFFGSARCIENGESLTILGGLTENTGNPADDVLVAELSRISNYQIRLNEELVKERIFPAIDYKACIIAAEAETMQNTQLKNLLRKKILPGKEEERFIEGLEEVNTEEELIAWLSK
jgi:transcription termination factor Rho